MVHHARVEFRPAFTRTYDADPGPWRREISGLRTRLHQSVHPVDYESGPHRLDPCRYYFSTKETFSLRRLRKTSPLASPRP